MSSERLTELAALAASVEDGSPEALRDAAARLLERPDGARAVLEVVRQMSLFCGFPRAVRALDVLHEDLPHPQGAEEPPADGSDCFQRLYGPDADPVRERLRRLDPLLARWILAHAYGQVLSRPGLTPAERERLAVLALAASGCWRQWSSHVRNARRLGVAVAELAADLERVPHWPGAENRARARGRLARLGDVPAAP